MVVNASIEYLWIQRVLTMDEREHGKNKKSQNKEVDGGG